ncbi:hypothetical protein AWW68_08640 [Roseivirga spongicola]|uniref:Secretion system C-terminal sorting domain-containing protein n=1 Tax=Roseivirga spongicola TaxID=333140 RepID=A0A150XB19_9BACT|nr:MULTISPECIES: T9SS type A sorting domain-containing protein [Roseivirga]KYG75886.1 hypothetical protein AWW68_08640 [Roseivirga spongicola]MBO6662844.1 T9SS type A sorting domain-containing protein [Roseivirga sp.]MBO6909778.1 T9SS type A sorting domain-containing protein [Roseivirga sp.]
MRPQNLWVIYFILFIPYTSYAQSAQLVSAMINGCSSPDGRGEFILLYSGANSFTASPTTIRVFHGSSSPASDLLTGSFATNSSPYVSALNSLLPVSGCSDLNFIATIPGTTNIPSGSHILIVNDGSTYEFDFSGWCGSSIGDVYVLISTDSNWPNSGAFPNNPSSPDHLRSTINGATTDFTYQNLWPSNTNGNYAAWNNGGGEPFVYSNYTDCNPTNTQSLPVKLLYFRGAQINNVVKLEWATANEENNSHFEIQRSTDGFDWNHLAFIEGGGSSKSELTYQYTDQAPLEERSFYRLIQQDFSGLSETFETISIWIDKKDFLQIYPNPGFGEINIVSETEITQVTACDSKGNVFTIPAISRNEFDVSALSPGLYFLSISTPNETRQRSFIKSDN